MPKGKGKTKVVYRGGERIKFVETLVRQSHFSKYEVERLLQVLKENSKPAASKKGLHMDRLAFNDFLYNTFRFTDDILIDRVFRVFDKDNDGFISETEWIKGMSVFLRGNFDEQTEFCFSVYDMNGDGIITREEMFHLLKPCLVKSPTEEDPDEGIKELVEIAYKKYENIAQHSNKINLEAFREGVMHEPLMLEGLGPCLPMRKMLEAFLEGVVDIPYNSGMSMRGTMKK